MTSSYTASSAAARVVRSYCAALARAPAWSVGSRAGIRVSSRPSASASGVAARTVPFTPSWIRSSAAGLCAATSGAPAARASIMLMGRTSLVLAVMNTSAAASASGTRS